MPYVIAEPCIGVKDGACAEVCPVECIHSDADENQFFINADECIDCGLCESSCPVEAIFADDALPPQWQHFIGINNAYFRR